MNFEKFSEDGLALFCVVLFGNVWHNACYMKLYTSYKSVNKKQLQFRHSWYVSLQRFSKICSLTNNCLSTTCDICMIYVNFLCI